MPKKLKEDEVKEWFDQIHLSLVWRQPYEDTWNRIIDYLRGLFYDDMSEEDRICVNMVRPHINVVIPAIYSKNPDVLVYPRRRNEASDELVRKRAEVMQNLLRYYLKELGVKTEVKLCILDAVMTGHAWIKTAYDAEFEELEQKKQSETLISKFLKSMGMQLPNEEEEDEDDIYAYNSKVTREQAFVLRCSPFDMVVPTLSRRPNELLWIAERFILPYDQVMDNPDFDTDGLKPSANANELLAGLRGAKYNKLGFADNVKYSILYEIWDKETEKVITLADGHNRSLQVKDSEYTMLDSKFHPYIQLRFNEIIDEFYPDGDIKPAEPQLLELNETRTQMNTHRKRYNRRYVIRPGLFSPTAKADLRSGEDATVVEVERIYADQPFEQLIFPVIDAALPAEVYQIEARIKDDIFTILGTSDYASQSSGGARTATEASIIATQSRFRVEERIDLIGDFVRQIIKNLAQISQKFMDQEQVGAIIGLDGIYWVQVQDNKEIQGDYAYDVVYASSAPINREVDREQFMKFYVIAKDDPYYDQVKLRLILARKFDLDNPEAWLVPQFAQEIEKQRMIALKMGALTPGLTNALGSTGPPGRVPRLPGGGSGSLRERQATGGMATPRPVVPGGIGGTEGIESPLG